MGADAVVISVAQDADMGESALRAGRRAQGRSNRRGCYPILRCHYYRAHSGRVGSTYSSTQNSPPLLRQPHHPIEEYMLATGDLRHSLVNRPILLTVNAPESSILISSRSTSLCLQNECDCDWSGAKR